MLKRSNTERLECKRNSVPTAHASSGSEGGRGTETSEMGNTKRSSRAFSVLSLFMRTDSTELLFFNSSRGTRDILSHAFPETMAHVTDQSQGHLLVGMVAEREN